MSGILDSKSRIIDAILTSEGRRQIAEDTFNVSYVSFTDADVVYEVDKEVGHVDPTSRIYFEACNLPQDQITFEANDEGKLVPFRNRDITIKSPDNFVGTTSLAKLLDGKLTAYASFHGRSIRVNTFFDTDIAKNKSSGFVYSDTSLITASVLLDSDSQAGSISFIAPSPGGPHKVYIGTKGGLSGKEFANAISGAIGKVTDSATGPLVFTTVADNYVYLDIGQSGSFLETILKTTGSVSSSILQLQESTFGSKLLTGEVETAAFASQIQDILTSSFDNFLELQTISTLSDLFEEDTFKLSTNEISFNLNEIKNKVTLASENYPPSVNEINSLFSDDKMSHLENFLYLPPIVKTSDTLAPNKKDITTLSSRLLGDYPSWGDNEKKLEYGGKNGIRAQVADFGNLIKNVGIVYTSRNNRVIGQVFEINNNIVSKLDVVDFDYLYNDITKTRDKIFFVGKTFLDNRGTTCFVNMFMLIITTNEGGL